MSEIKDKQSANNLISQIQNKKNLPVKDARNPKLLEAARMFENQFLRQIITEMRKTVPDGGLIEDSMAQKVYRDQLDDQYSDMWTKNGGIGLGDLIYQQLEDKMHPQFSGTGKIPGQGMPLTKKVPGTFLESQPSAQIKANNYKKVPGTFSDLISSKDKDLFLLKKTNHGLYIKSREPLPEYVDVKAPMSGLVLQAAALGEGKEMVILGHDQGLKTQYVHSGKNLVHPGQRIIAGQALARLPASRQGEQANVVFGLRQDTTIE